MNGCPVCESSHSTGLERRADRILPPCPQADYGDVYGPYFRSAPPLLLAPLLVQAQGTDDLCTRQTDIQSGAPSAKRYRSETYRTPVPVVCPAREPDWCVSRGDVSRVHGSALVATGALCSSSSTGWKARRIVGEHDSPPRRPTSRHGARGRSTRQDVCVPSPYSLLRSAVSGGWGRSVMA